MCLGWLFLALARERFGAAALVTPRSVVGEVVAECHQGSLPGARLLTV